MSREELQDATLHRVFDWCADFLFTQRKESRKWVSDLSGAEVTEVGTSHFGRLVATAVLLVVGAVIVGYWQEVYVALTTETPRLDVFFYGIISILCLPITFLYAVFVPKMVFGFWKKKQCESCGKYTRYPHKLARAIPDTSPTESETHWFCTRNCREIWERENMDYREDHWYDLQTERDKQHWNAIAEREIIEGNHD